MTHAEAIEHARTYFLRHMHDGLKHRWSEETGAAAYLSTRPLMPGELELRVGELRQQMDADGTWVLFVDLCPPAAFAHPCMYVLFAHDGSSLGFEAQWFPKGWGGVLPEGQERLFTQIAKIAAVESA